MHAQSPGCNIVEFCGHFDVLNHFYCLVVVICDPVYDVK